MSTGKFPRGPYHPRMTVQRLHAFLRAGSASQSAWMFVVVATLPAGLIAELRRGSPWAPTLALIGAWCLVAYGLSWVVVAKIAVDARAVEAHAARYGDRTDAALLSAPAPFTCDEDEFAAIVEAELDVLPRWIQAGIARDNVAVDVEDERPGSARTLGLFRSHIRDGAAQNEITLYRLPIIRAAGSRDHLRGVVHDTLLHELGHLFGMTEGDLDEYSIGNQPRPDAKRVHPALDDGGPA